jgi:hypothetical protein
MQQHSRLDRDRRLERDLQAMALGVRQNFPSQGASQQSLRPTISVKSDIPQLSLIVLEEFAALRNEQLFLFGPTALGVFLLVASRNPSAHRRLIAFAAWSSFAHAAVMGVQAFLRFIARRELLGVATFIVIGVALISLAPAKAMRQPTERVSAAASHLDSRLTPPAVNADLAVADQRRKATAVASSASVPPCANCLTSFSMDWAEASGCWNARLRRDIPNSSPLLFVASSSPSL